MLAKMNVYFTRLTSCPDLAKLLLRLTVAGLMLLHGVNKIQHGIGWVSHILTQAGYPAFIAYGVYLGEIIAPLFLILGIFCRPMALIMAINMAVAFLLAHQDKIMQLSKNGGWALELNCFYFIVSLAILFLGGGRFSVVKNEAYQ